MKCPYCQQEAEWVSNDEIYGRRYGKSYMMWVCRQCDARVGCHNNTKRPLGTMANKELRDKRVAVHAMVDQLWKYGKYKRGAVYKRLSEAFGKQIHIAEATMQECDDIIKTVPMIFSEGASK